MSAYYYCEPADIRNHGRGNDHPKAAARNSGSRATAISGRRVETGRERHAETVGDRRVDTGGDRHAVSFSSRTFVLGLLIAISLFGGFLVTAYAKAESPDNGLPTGRSDSGTSPIAVPAGAGQRIIDVAPGDSLWSIAREHSDGHSIRSYIKELKQLNNLSSNQLQIGQLLLLPDDK